MTEKAEDQSKLQKIRSLMRKTAHRPGDHLVLVPGVGIFEEHSPELERLRKEKE